MTRANFTGRAGQFVISKDGRELATVVSEKREFKPNGTPTTEVGIHQTLAGDVYVVMGDKAADGGRVVRMYFNPLVSMIWLGALIMFAGGVLSLTDRRYRIGAPKPALTMVEVPAE
jgi:cytochrome c-type biogenesis protein CcmF